MRAFFVRESIRGCRSEVGGNSQWRSLRGVNPNDSALARRWRPRHHGNPYHEL
jgi:hypothetical protein